MEPLTITARTPHGVVLSRPHGVSFDGLLASVLWHRAKYAAYATGAPWRRFSALDTPAVLELPLARCGDIDQDEDWHWACTFSEQHPHTTQPSTRWRTSRTDHARLQQISPSISPSRVTDRAGRYQSRLIPILAHLTTSLTWHAVGDADAIRELLEELPAIGKHTGTGEGIVTDWTVAPAPELSVWSAGHEHSPGILGRPTPVRCTGLPGATTGIGDEHELRTTAVRGPYLHPSTRFAAYLPHR